MPMMKVSEAINDRWASPGAEWNSTQAEYPRNRCIHQLFEEQARSTPQAVALVSGDQQFTYAQLDARANQLAHYLRQKGVRPNVLVALCMERSLDLIVGVLGILKAGGAYVPLDASYPSERLAHMLQDAQSPLLLTQQRLQQNLPPYEGETICLDSDWDRIRQMPADAPATEVSPNDLIYVIYTSGSTGKPKGTAVFHRGFSNLMRWFVEEFGFTAADRSLLVTSISFDLTQKNLYAALCVGGQLHLAPSGPYDPEVIAEAIAQCGATHLNCTPSHFYPLVAEAIDASYQRLRSLRYVYLGGEPIDLPQLTPWLSHSLCQARLVNTYGPTECSDIATYYILPKPAPGESAAAADRTLPIGRAIPHVTLSIVDENHQPVPEGTVGELYIGGAGVGYGYVGRPELTAEKFLPDPFSSIPGARLYRTGDMCRALPDGNIEFMGRVDHQVKIRGFRIELGEIESVLAQWPEVSKTLVMAREDIKGDQRLVAYLVGSEASQDLNLLRDYLRERLPDYMVPAAFVFLEAFPLSLNGKIDRRALPAPDWRAVAAGPFVAPSTPLEEPLAELWRKVLGVTEISVNAGFFELGGHSLLAIRLLSEIKQKLGTTLSLAEMIKAPTVAQMALLIQRKREGEETWSPIVALQPHGDRPPLFCAPVGGGSAFYYRTLAEQLGVDQPVYVFEPIGMNGIDPPHETVEEMAAFYIQHLRTIQPHGPYRICGLSFGGNVAYEMALQLQAAGEQIACLILFDSCALGYPGDRSAPDPRKMRYALRVLRYKLRFHTENLTACASLGERWDYVRARSKRLQGRLREWRPGKPGKMYWENPISQTLPEVFQKVSQVEAHSREIYRPKRYSGRILLLRARLQPPTMETEPTLGWDRLANDIEVIHTPGSHYSLLEKPHVHVTLKHVIRTLADLDTSHSTPHTGRSERPHKEARDVFPSAHAFHESSCS